MPPSPTRYMWRVINALNTSPGLQRTTRAPASQWAGMLQNEPGLSEFNRTHALNILNYLDQEGLSDNMPAFRGKPIPREALMAAMETYAPSFREVRLGGEPLTYDETGDRLPSREEAMARMLAENEEEYRQIFADMENERFEDWYQPPPEAEMTRVMPYDPRNPMRVEDRDNATPDLFGDMFGNVERGQYYPDAPDRPLEYWAGIDAPYFPDTEYMRESERLREAFEEIPGQRQSDTNIPYWMRGLSPEARPGPFRTQSEAEQAIALARQLHRQQQREQFRHTGAYHEVGERAQRRLVERHGARYPFRQDQGVAVPYATSTYSLPDTKHKGFFGFKLRNNPLSRDRFMEGHFTARMPSGEAVGQDVAGHVRFGTYVLSPAEAKTAFNLDSRVPVKVLISDENQSVWQQGIRDDGYKRVANPLTHQAVPLPMIPDLEGMSPNMWAIATRPNPLLKGKDKRVIEGGPYTKDVIDDLIEGGAWAVEQVKGERAAGGYPDMPYKDTADITEIQMQRMLIEAAQQDAPVLAWLDGKSQARRYGHVARMDVRYNPTTQVLEVKGQGSAAKLPNTNTWTPVMKHDDGKPVEVKPNAVVNFVDYDVAKKLTDPATVDAEGFNNMGATYVYSKGFVFNYDTLYPQVVDRLLKPWKIKTKTTTLPNGQRVHYVVLPQEARETWVQRAVMFGLIPVIAAPAALQRRPERERRG